MTKDENIKQIITKIEKWLDVSIQKALLDIKWTESILPNDGGNVKFDEDSNWSDKFRGEWE
ncbi:MAG: hypothetical protein QF440_02280 [Candidatus Thalassarchaeaceae archaeon]|jgi:hypothetical protein|nr:hypothetical protein [Candidatus Thalassarchaeaceae archaeon]